MNLEQVTALLEQMRREVEIPVSDAILTVLELHEDYRGKLPVPGEPLERVYKLARVRINRAADDYTAFYELETTRCA